MNTATAFHEARHAAACLLLGVPIRRATAIPDATTNGRCTISLEGVDRPLARSAAKALLVGYLHDEDADDWPPDFPQEDARRTDERQLSLLARYLGLDDAGWRGLCTDAYVLAAKPEFMKLEKVIAGLLEQGHVLDEQFLKYAYVSSEKKMEHATKAAVATATDQGVFTALAATWAVDRSGERIQRGAFANTIARWRSLGRPVPLHWDHKGGDPEFVIGAVDEMRETEDGLLVEGTLDLEHSSVAREAWRAMRSGAIGLSFGFLVQKAHSEGGVRVLDQLDLFEITLTPHPVNDTTKVLSMKSMAPSRVLTFEC